MKKKKLNKKVVLVIALIILLIGGTVYYFLFANKDEKGATPFKTTTTTGPALKIVDTSKNSRPYAVSINNIGVARPLQSGLQDAYIMYEFIVEGGLTRYLALFMDQNTERIGSIRSARHYFLDYVLENDAIFVHNGQSPQAQSDFSALGIDRIVVDNSKTGWRDKSLNVASEHTLFTSTAKLKNGIGKKRTERKGGLLLNYSVDEVDLSTIANAKAANSVEIKYSGSMKSQYEYDTTNKVYKRSVNGKAHKDYVTGNQYTFKNIITYQLKNYPLNDGSGKDRQNVETVGNGTGYYITDGYAVPISWSKSSRSAKTIYKYEDGKEIDVNDGNTFIQIQPEGQSLTIN